MTASYPYGEGDLLSQPHTYFYSAFGGRAFLDAWRAQRLALAAWFEASATLPQPGSVDTDEACRLFAATATDFDRGQCDDALRVVARLVQRFEVSKRVYGSYDLAMRPVDREDYRLLPRYVVFGELLERAYRASRHLPCLNALLKLNDILAAHRDAVPTGWRSTAARLQRAELHHVTALAETRVEP